MEQYVFGTNWNQCDIEWFSSLIFQKMKSQHLASIYLHYSDMEHTYGDSVKFLINDLSEHGIKYDAEILHYENHGDVGLYYPAFLQEKINKVVFDSKER